MVNYRDLNYDSLGQVYDLIYVQRLFLSSVNYFLEKIIFKKNVGVSHYPKHGWEPVTPPLGGCVIPN